MNTTEESKDSLKTIQKTVLKRIKEQINDASFEALFSDELFSLVSLKNNHAIFVSSSPSLEAFINKTSYPEKIKKELEKITEDEVEVQIISKENYNKLKEKKEEKNYDQKKYFKNSVLLQNFTFDNFVMGPSNRQAYLASLQSVEYPGRYNPLFIYSKSGLGKTHLLYAIGNKYEEKYPEKKIQYITTNNFVDTIINHFKNDESIQIEELKNYFYSVDLLLIDDIQFLADKKSIQMIFFDIFNILVSSGKQIVITSDRSPVELKGLEDRLVTRFSGGLSLNITPPDKKTLLDILKIKIQSHGYSLSMFDDDAMEYLALNHSKNVRELEGALTNLLFNMAILKPQGTITLDFVASVFADEKQIVEKKGKTTIDSIIEDVANYYSLTTSQLRSKIRTSQIALARQIAMYLARDILSLPYQVIGREFQKDHSTVVANVNKIEEKMKKDPSFKSNIIEIKKFVKREER